MSLNETPLSTGRHRTRRFGIAWRNSVARSIHDVAVLDANPHGFRFQYREDAALVEGFRPFIGFPELEHVYESPRLWPFFDLRVMDRRRPDYVQFLKWLGLPAEADRLDVLARHGGWRKGDTVTLAEAPPVDSDGLTSATFIVRGSGHVDRSHGFEKVVDRLQSGELLGVRDDATNVANSAAILLTAAGVPVGWVPDLLIEYAREVVTSGGTVTVLQNNGPKAPWHVRLLVRIDGKVSRGWSTFAGAGWPPAPVAVCR